MNKKGQGLPLTTIIIAILVVVVLIVIIAFFIGGSTQLTDSIKRVFFGTTAGYDFNLALETCQSRCDLAKDMPITNAQENSAYCQTPLQVDKSPIDGEADYAMDGKTKKTIKYFCPPKDRYYDANEESYTKFLDIDCDLGTDKDNQEIKCDAPAALGGGNLETLTKKLKDAATPNERSDTSAEGKGG